MKPLAPLLGVVADALVSFFGILTLIGLVYLGLLGIMGHDARGALALEGYDSVASIGCATNSMGLTLRCNDTVLLRRVGPREELQVGHLYSYQRGNQSVLHRLVLCMNNCTTIIMKGDNNKVAERIRRDAIQYEAIGAYYDTK